MSTRGDKQYPTKQLWECVVIPDTPTVPSSACLSLSVPLDKAPDLMFRLRANDDELSTSGSWTLYVVALPWKRTTHRGSFAVIIPDGSFTVWLPSLRETKSTESVQVQIRFMSHSTTSGEESELEE